MRRDDLSLRATSSALSTAIVRELITSQSKSVFWVS